MNRSKQYAAGASPSQDASDSGSNLSGGSNPLVSVIIPTYNRAWSLRKCVESVFAQEYRPIECIVVDDGSIDDTSEVAARLADDVPDGVTFRYMRKENGGANSARNRGLAEAQGELICYLDSDDWLLPESVKIRADVLSCDPTVSFTYGLCAVVDREGKEIRTMNAPWPAAGEARVAPYLFHTNAPMIRRDICEKSGPWREDDPYAQEYEYFARVKFFSDNVVFIDRVLSAYQRHDAGNIFDLCNRDFLLAVYRVVLAIKGLVLFSTHDSSQERVAISDEFHKVAKQLYRVHDYRNARMALRESLLLSWRPRRFAQLCVLSILSLKPQTAD